MELPIPTAIAHHPPPVTEKKSTWFRKVKSKEDKHKAHKAESPSKEIEATDSNNHATTITPTDGSGDGGGGGVGGGSKLSLTDKDKIQEQIKKLGIDFFSEDFEGTTMSSTRCLSCETVTEQKETMIDLSVPITANMDTVDQSNLIEVFIFFFFDVVYHI